MNRKPTIRFETEQLSGTRVEITAIVTTTNSLESIKVNASEIDNSDWNITKTNNELTITTTFVATKNGTYIWTVVDSVGNEVTESINITTIDDKAAVVTYETFDVTEYSAAKIEFNANQDVRISKVIKPDGIATNIITGKEFSGMTFENVDFARRVVVKISNTTFEKGTTFVFENKSFIETYVTIEKDIQTKIMYVRTVSKGTKLFSDLFGDNFTKENAELLVNQMTAKTKDIDGKVTPYYGITGQGVGLKVSEQDELRAISYLASATNMGETLKLNKYGDAEKLKATVTRNIGGNNATYTNGNITGLKVFGNILEWTGSTIKNTFRITIRPK
jgi:hypothetical protein